MESFEGRDAGEFWRVGIEVEVRNFVWWRGFILLAGVEEKQRGVGKRKKEKKNQGDGGGRIVGFSWNGGLNAFQ